MKRFIWGILGHVNGNAEIWHGFLTFFLIEGAKNGFFIFQIWKGFNRRTLVELGAPIGLSGNR